jgi:sorting nexin-1/2
MDEIFKMNSPPTTSQQIKLTDDEEDDPFDPSQSRAAANKHKESAGSVAPAIAAVNGKSATEVKHTSFDDVMMEDEDRDKFLEISLSDPTKVGEGMSSYMVYKLTCKTNFPMFKKSEFGTQRRFSDFLSLYEKLKEKHLVAGRILPPAPEKDMLGTAKVKMSKEETPTIDFIDKRRAALERFLNRLGKHKTFRYDPDFRDFLEIESELPKATNTSALSGAGMVKMFKNLTDSVSKISIKMEEGDPVSYCTHTCSPTHLA